MHAGRERKPLIRGVGGGIGGGVARIAHITVEEIIHLPEITTKKGRITEAVRWIIMGGVVSGGWYACR